MKIFLISCVKRKQQGVYAAKDLYISSLFKKMFAYAKKNNADEIYVLSAKHGLINQETQIENYEETLNTKSIQEKKIWAENVFNNIKNWDKTSHIYILGGKNYYYFLEKLLIQNGFKVTIPLKGLSIGKMLSFLNKF